MIEAQTVGKNKKQSPIWVLNLNTISQTYTLQEMIKMIVHEEVTHLQSQQSQNHLSPVRTSAEIEVMHKTGMVHFDDKTKNPILDLDDAVAKAIQAFENSMFYVFVNERQIHALSEEIKLIDKNKIVFIRFVPLVGG